MTTPDQSPLRPPRPALREIDWLALAPWLLLLRAPQAALGKPLLLGVLGALLLAGGREPGTPPPQSLRESMQAAMENSPASPGAIAERWEAWRAEAAFDQPSRSATDWAWLLLRCAGWGWIGLAIVDHAGRRLTGSEEIGVAASIRRAAVRWPTLLGALGLAGGAALLLYGLLALVGWFAKAAWLSPLIAACWPAPVVLLGVPLAFLLAGLAVGWPLLMAAIAIDAADAFDAVSRMYAYAYQRLARLAWYVLVAAAVGVVTAMAVEAAASLVFQATHYGFGDLRGDETATGLIRWWQTVLARAVDGYYPAYFFTATTAIYLLLRRDIDGQPLDERDADQAPGGA